MSQLTAIWLIGLVHWQAFPLTDDEQFFSVILIALSAGVLLGGWTP